ncbi:hypothetical protein Scep_022234 [Stephania cephalantha]|uniref:Uncharacterized protein n=1 Tax=Stephania cephalantha TaxID=152367 RepID=A0AAP0I235_9MAGN
MAYASRLLREQPIMSSSFVEVTTPCPLLLCLIGDQFVRLRATAPLPHTVHYAAAASVAAAAPSQPLMLLPRSRHRHRQLSCRAAFAAARASRAASLPRAASPPSLSSPSVRHHFSSSASSVTAAPPSGTRITVRATGRAIFGAACVVVVPTAAATGELLRIAWRRAAGSRHRAGAAVLLVRDLPRASVSSPARRACTAARALASPKTNAAPLSLRAPCLVII